MIIAFANEKGGSGKTTSCAAVATGATYRKKRSLAIDMDGQANLSFIMGGDPRKPGTYELLQGKAKAADVIQRTEQGDIITASKDLMAADSVLQGDARIYALKRAIKPIRGFYDVIVIDTPPALSTPLINSLTAAEGVIIPLRAEMINLQGLYSLDQTICSARDQYNPDLHALGVLFTEYNGRTIAARNMTETIENTARDLDIPVFNARIRRSVSVSEAQIMRESLFEYAPKSNPAQDYLQFLDELGI